MVSTNSALHLGLGGAERRGDWPDLLAAIIALAPTAIAVLDGAEHRYSVVNDAYRALARGKGELLGRTLAEVWPEAAAGVVPFLDRVFQTGEAYQAEEAPFEVVRGRGRETIWLTLSFSPMREPSGEITRLLVMTSDVTEHVRSRRALRDEQERLLRSSELTEALSNAQSTREVTRTVFEKGLAVFGADAGALAVPVPDAPKLLEIVDQFGYSAELVASWRRFSADLPSPVADAYRTGVPVWVGSPEEALERFPNWAPSVIASDQAWAGLPLRVGGRTLGALGLAFRRARTFDAGYRTLIVSVAQRCAQALDRALLIDELSRREQAATAAERRQRFIVTLTDAVRALADPVEVQGRAAHVLGEHLKASRVHYTEVIEDGRFGVVNADYCDGLPSVVGRHRCDDYGFTVMNELRAGRTLVVKNVPKDTRLGAAERAATSALSVGAYIIVPLIKNGLAVALLVVQCSEPRAWAASEISLIEETAERTWAAVERARAEAALRQSDRRLRTLIDNVNVGVALVDEGGRFILYNARFLGMFGLAPESTIANVNDQDWGRWEVVDESHRALPLDEHPVRKVAHTGRPVQNELVGVRLPSGGDLIWMLVSADTIPVAGGSHIICTYQDVTTLRQAEETLRLADERKSDFLAILSHELRNPLAPIRNSVLLIDSAPPDSDAARRARDVLQRQTEHLARLVDDLLDITRITHGKIEIQLARIDAQDVVGRAVDDVRTVFEQRSVGLHFSHASEQTWVDADPARLTQMVGNLLNNALKFTRPGGRVYVGVRPCGGKCEVRVRDTGIGIELADLERIFNPFVQAERTRGSAQGGMGIGLALVSELALKHGGAVRATSGGPGMGAEFILTIPLAAAPVDAASTLQVGQGAAGLSVLIVDDNEDAGATLADLLALTGHQVEVVTTGRAGVDAVAVHPPDVLICDVGLPDLNGYDVIRAIRSNTSASGVFAIALTGYAQPRDRKQALDAGFDSHLPKPAPLDDLRALLAEVARRREARATPEA